MHHRRAFHRFGHRTGPRSNRQRRRVRARARGHGGNRACGTERTKCHKQRAVNWHTVPFEIAEREAEDAHITLTFRKCDAFFCVDARVGNNHRAERKIRAW